MFWSITPLPTLSRGHKQDRKEKVVSGFRQDYEGHSGPSRGSSPHGAQSEKRTLSLPRRAAAAQTLTQESVDAYMYFMDSMFSYWQGVTHPVERGARENPFEKAARGKKKS